MNLFAASVVGGVVLVSSVVWQFRQSIWPGRSGRLGEPVVKQFVPTNRTALAGSVNNINQISTSSSWSVIEDEASLRVPIGVSTDTLSQPSHQAPRGIEELSSTEQEPNSVDAEPNRLTELDDAVGEALVETAPAFAASTSDGLGVDGLGVDGLGVDGLGVDGLGVDGLSVDGLGVETDGPIEANGLIECPLR